MFKRIVLIFVCGLVFCDCFGQAPSWQWAKSAGGGIGYDMGMGVCMDLQNNCYVTGSFEGGTITFDGITLNSPGSYADAFVVKYDASGNVIWARNFGGIWGEKGSSISADGSGNIYVTGGFGSPFFIFGGDSITNNGIGNIFIVKYDSSGNEIWGKSAGGANADAGYGISVDPFGNCCVTGTYTSSTITFGSTTLTNSGFDDIFITKFDVAGNIIWAKKAGGFSYDYCSRISTNVLGNVCVTGTFWSDSISIGSTTLINGGNVNFFVANFDFSGTLLWATCAGGVSGLEGVTGDGVRIDAMGNSYVTGSLNGTGITFDSYTFNSVAGSLDLFIAKYDASGNVVWAKKTGGISSEIPSGISIDATGNSYITGSFQGLSATFGSTTLINNGVMNVFVAKFNSSGNVIWAKSGGGSYWDVAASITSDVNNCSYITGQFRSAAISFGSINLTNTSVDSIADFFIAKLDNNVGVDEEENSSNTFNIFPNPISGTIHLSISTKHNAPLGCEIINMMGERVYESPLPASLPRGEGSYATLDISFLAKGIYLVRVGDRERWENKKLVIK